MWKINDGRETLLIGSILEGFFYGLYSGIFVMYLQHESSKKDTDKKRTIVFYSICLLYVLFVALFVVDTMESIYQLPGKPIVPLLRIYFIDMALFGFCDLIAQFILIYRCWIVWGCNIRVVIIPSILAFAFLVLWLVAASVTHISSGEFATFTWASLMTLSGLTLSLAVNLLVTGLIVFRIFKVFRGLKAMDGENLGATAGSKLWRVIFILIESGIALFCIQLARIVLTFVVTDPNNIVFALIIAIHVILTGITPTIILVRTSMGLSFHDEKSMEEAVIGSLRFAYNHSNSVQETGSINISTQDNGDGDIGVERSSGDLDLVER